MLSHSDATPAKRFADGECVIGCTIKGVHFATCPDYAAEPGEGTCRGCAPSPAHEGSAICSKCFGRMRAVLADAPDIVGRLRSLSDPTKAMLIEPVKVSSRPVDAVAPVGSDLLDAADAILLTLRDWAWAVTPTKARGWLPWHQQGAGMDALTAFRLASAYSGAIRAKLQLITADPQQSIHLAEGVITRHPVVDGERAAWSIRDALDMWGIERRSDTFVFPDEDEELEVTNVPEWKDRLIVKSDAEREAGSARTLRRWVKEELIAPAGRVRYGNVVTSWYRYSDIVRIRQENRERQREGK